MQEVQDRPAATPPAALAPEVVAQPVTRRWAIILVVLIAGISAYVSARHQFALARLAGEPPEVAWTLPALIDGSIAVSSVVLLDAARRKVARPLLAVVSLAVGIASTVAANVAAGWSGGVLSWLVSAVAPLAFASAIHMLMGLLRRQDNAPVATVLDQPEPAPVPFGTPEPLPAPAVPGTAIEAARTAYEASITEGKPISERGLGDRFKLTRPQARAVIGEVVIEAVAGLLALHPSPPIADYVANRYGVSAKRAGELIGQAVKAHAEKAPQEPTDEDRLTGTLNWALTGAEPAAVNGTGA
ncbi:DUF2637 domain-containing protein [Acrocarpospora sp. B8E8]|uniref:DUF2637 domain-containing protein n=1 Tax=Acrocarpospora sp. B8E8 TaxID=3153572 RepID=UPI00325D6325